MTHKIVLATQNTHKISELSNILGSDWAVEPCPKVCDWDETGTTLSENALIKATAVAKHLGEAVIADDSGLFVDALQGRPGVFSSRYAGVDATDRDNYLKLLEEMKDQTLRQAQFRCCICYLQPNQAPKFFEGILNGAIGYQPEGHKGFGYDPVFIPDGSAKSLALYSAEEKDAISHRKKALEKFVQFIA